MKRLRNNNLPDGKSYPVLIYQYIKTLYSI